MNRKGTEKPIEIFVALFIILAVALVMLKLFQSQIADQQKKIVDIQEEQKSKETLQKVRQACTDKCVDASSSCNLASLAAICTLGSQKVLGKNSFIDLNNDKKNDYDDTLLAGIGVCEDNIYCFHNLVSTCCGYDISPEGCKGILKDYWESKGLVERGNAAALHTMLANTVPAGSCTDNGATSRRWDRVANWTGVTS